MNIQKITYILSAFIIGLTFPGNIAYSASCTLNTEQAYKSPESTAVYYITRDCTKKVFKNSPIYFTYFDSWSEVQETSATTLTRIADDAITFMPFGPKYDPQYGALVKTLDDPKVYLLLGGEKYWITSENVFTSLGYSGAWIEDVDPRLLDAYVVGSEITYTNRHPNYTLITYPGDSKVYRIEPHPHDPSQQVKRHIPSEIEFNALGFRGDRIVTIDVSEQYLDKEAVLDMSKTAERYRDYTYTIYETTHEQEGLSHLDGYLDDDIRDRPMVAVVRKNAKALVPKGYEELGKAHVEDLLLCEPLLSDFFGGVSFPLDEMIAKIYISNDNSHRGFALFGQIFYKLSQSSIDSHLADVLTNNPEGFLYQSSPTHCANSHELMHAFFYDAPLMRWANEGIAQFTQLHNQGDLYTDIECKENGYTRYGTFTPYQDLSDENNLDYTTAMCAIEEIVETYGWDSFYAMLERLDQYQRRELREGPAYKSTRFVESVLQHIYGDSILDVIKKYGIERGDWIEPAYE